MKSSFLVGIVAASIGVGCALNSRAQNVTNEFSFANGQTVPDNDLTGLADTRIISSPIVLLSDVRVTLDISGGFNGDLFAYLTHGSGFAVLLNRTGKTTSDLFGYADAGFLVSFDHNAVNGDIHNYQPVVNPNGGVLTGNWQPDARNIHPNNVLDTDARTANLGSFTGLNPNGEWTLFIADSSPVSESVLNGWAIQIVGAVPEPSAYALMTLGFGLVVWKFKRRSSSK